MLVVLSIISIVTSAQDAYDGAFKRTTDGYCETMVNGFGSHQFCYNERRVQQMLEEIRVFTSMSAQ